MPASEPRDIQWAKLNDFSFGVADRDYRATGQIGPWPLGAARANETFRCRALPAGGLGPLPRRDNSFSFPYPLDVDPATNNGEVQVVGFLIQGPVQAPGTTTGYDEANWIVATEYLSTDIDPDERRHMFLHRVQMWLSARPRDLIISRPDAFAGGIHRHCWLESSRISESDPTDPGVPVVCFAWYGDASGTLNSAWGFWPDPSAPSGPDPIFVDTGTYAPGPMIVYQGRSMICDRQPYPNGPDSAVWSTNEELYFTLTNLATLSSSLASVFTPEDPGEILGVCVSSANELFVLKRRQGAYVVRGDIVLPVALRMPGIMGTGKMIGRPLAAPMGVVYTSLGSGVYVWPGGEESQCISEQLEPSNFEYNLSGPWEFQESFGRADYFQDLIFVVPNWVYDWKRNAWWRLDDPDDTEAPNGYLYFQKSLSKRSIVAVRGEYNDGEDYAFTFNFDAGAASYQWASQPLPFSLDRDVEVREIVLRVTGAPGSTVLISISSVLTSQDQIFDVDETAYPLVLRAPMAISGGDLKVRIVADSNDPDTPAPIVYGVDIGYYVTAYIPETPAQD